MFCDKCGSKTNNTPVKFWLLVRSLIYGFVMGCVAQVFFQAINSAHGFPTPGALIFGVLSVPNWRIIEAALIVWNRK